MRNLHETEKALNSALCEFLNSVGDPFTPASDWNEEVKNNGSELCKAYNAWYVWLKSTGHDPFEE